MADITKKLCSTKTILPLITKHELKNVFASRCTHNSLSRSSERSWMITAIVLILSNVCFIVWIISSKRGEIRNGLRGGYGYCNNYMNEEDMVPYLSRADSSDKNGVYVAGVNIDDSVFTMALSKKDSPEDCILFGAPERISLLFNGQTTAFGNDAFEQYMENENTNLRYEEGFKLSNESIDSVIYKEAIAHILKRLQNALDTCTELSNEMQSQAHYVFVVPTYWSEEAKKRLRKEIIERKGEYEHQNIDEQRLHVITRELTLLPFIHEVNARVSCLKFKVKNLIFDQYKGNNSYAVLHIGSTCCELIFLKVDTSKISKKMRKNWKKQPLHHLLNLLVPAYGSAIVGTWIKDHKREYIKILHEFEKLHKNRTKYTKGKTAFTLDLPKSLTSKKKKLKAEEIDPETNKLKITTEKLEEMFKEMKEQVKEWIISEKKSFEKVRCVVMTGTYSNMEMVLDEAEDEWFKDKPVTIVVPENLHVFAMGGAYYIQNKIREQRNQNNSQKMTSEV